MVMFDLAKLSCLYIYAPLPSCERSLRLLLSRSLESNIKINMIVPSIFEQQCTFYLLPLPSLVTSLASENWWPVHFDMSLFRTLNFYSRDAREINNIFFDINPARFMHCFYQLGYSTNQIEFA